MDAPDMAAKTEPQTIVNVPPASRVPTLGEEMMSLRSFLATEGALALIDITDDMRPQVIELLDDVGFLGEV